MNPGVQGEYKGTKFYTKGNIGNFFKTPFTGLNSSQIALVKTFSDNFGHSAAATLENTPYELAHPIIDDMVGSYSKNVALIVHGWVGGNG